MKKLVSLILVFVLMLSVLVCAQASTISDNQTTRNAETSSAEAEKAQAEPYVVKVYDAASFTDKHSALTNKSGEHVESSAILTTHYLMSDGTWRVQKYDGSGMDDKVFNHRYILSSGNSFDFPLVMPTILLTKTLCYVWQKRRMEEWYFREELLIKYWCFLQPVL